MWNKIFLLGLLIGGCAAIPPSEYREENLGTLVSEDEQETVNTPETLWVGSQSLESEAPEELVLYPECECHLQVRETRGLICFGTICSEECSEHTRACATLMGGCTIR